jgi:hypothetical protein
MSSLTGFLFAIALFFATNMSSLSGVLIAIALFFAANMSSLAGFLFAIALFLLLLPTYHPRRDFCLLTIIMSMLMPTTMPMPTPSLVGK